MVTLGQRLKAEREQRGLTIEKLASETRIHARYFDAIEEDRISDLPSGFFYRSFVRQYARILELPESDYMPAIQRFLDDEAHDLDARGTALPQRIIDVPPMPTGRFNAGEETKRWLVRLALLVIVIAASSGLYYLYQRWKSAPAETPIVTEQPPPERTSQPQAPPPQTQPPPPSGETQPAEPAQGQQIPPAAEQPKPAEPQPPAQPSSLNLTLVASADTWIQLTADGKTLFMDVLKAGQARSFRGNSFMRLRLGNAGGVSMEFNGSAVPPAGPVGQVRTVEFTPEGARVVTPPVTVPEITPLPVPRQEQQN
jgi:cytoskeletal protein RodZ